VAETVEIRVDGRARQVASDVTLAAALLSLGQGTLRRSVRGEARGPVCGMGICFECRVVVDGVANRRACLERVREGMDVVTGS
jgi:D-hydroxyproline dehydrogenase subunit gamma